MDYTFTVTPEEANIIAKGLGELPTKIGMAVLIKLKNQAEQQDKQAETKNP
jgi:hypothetical protein